MKVVIAGGGAVGSFIADELQRAGHDVHIIEHRQIIGLQLASKTGKTVVTDDRYSVLGKRLLTVDTHHRDGE